MVDTVWPEGVHWYPNSNQRKTGIGEGAVINLDDSAIQFCLNDDTYDDRNVDYKNIERVYERQFSYDISDLRAWTETPQHLIGDTTRVTGIEIVTSDEDHLFISRTNKGENKHPSQFNESFLQDLIDRSTSNGQYEPSYEFMPVSPFDNRSGELKVEEWTDGAAKIESDLKAESESEGGSKGIQVGPFSRSKSESKSSIEGDISGEISDNSFSTEVYCFKIYDERLFLNAFKINLDLYYSELENVYEERNGIILDTGSITFRIGKISDYENLTRAVRFMKSKIVSDNLAPSDQENADVEPMRREPAEKLRELKELRDDGILTEQEFESKKDEILDDF
jgi:hypothetical protein